MAGTEAAVDFLQSDGQTRKVRNVKFVVPVGVPSNEDGSETTVYVQAVTLVDGDGNLFDPRDLLRVLQQQLLVLNEMRELMLGLAGG